MPAVAVVCESFQLLLERDDILYHQATSRTKNTTGFAKKQDDITTWTVHVFVIRCFVGRWLTSYGATRRAG